MNNPIATNSVRFILLILAQVLIFNNINLFGHYNPYIYIIFIFLYPLKKEIGTFLVLSFLLGLSIDFFNDSGGINAAATLLIAYIRIPVLNAILRKTDYDYLLFNLRSISFDKSLIFISILTIIHHITLFTLEYFSLKDLGSILSKSIVSSFLTILLSVIVIILFTSKKNAKR